MRRIGRSRKFRSTRAVATRRNGERPDRVVVARAANVCAHRHDRQFLLHRAVVSEDRRTREQRVELSSVPRSRRNSSPTSAPTTCGSPCREGGSSAPPALERDRRDEADGTTTHHYYQDDVHDFAWTTSPDYVERHASFEHPVSASRGHATAPAEGACRSGRHGISKPRARR